MAKNYKSIFFDADDTLFDYPSAERAALRACLDEFAVPIEAGTIRRMPTAATTATSGRRSSAAKPTRLRLRVERFRRLAAELAIPDLPLERISTFYLEALAEPVPAAARGAGHGAKTGREDSPWP